MYYSLITPLVIQNMSKPLERPVRFGQVRFNGMGLEPTPGVRMVTLANADAVGQKAANMVADQLKQKPASSIVFPTGNTPKPMNAHLRALKGINWQQSRLFHLDEYLNPTPAQAPVYSTFADDMDRELWQHIPVTPQNLHYFRDYTPEAYDSLVMGPQGEGPDMVILGIGADGHIAFNMPGPESGQTAPSRLTRINKDTQAANFKDQAGQPGYPIEAKTLGIGTILKAKKIILLATGENKKEAIQRAFDPKRPASSACPASWLRFHPNVTVLTDFSL